MKYLALLLICLSSALAQEVRATIGGRVTDPQGSVVPGAAITLISEDTNVKYEAKANQHGIWTIEFLLPAHYRLTAAAPGFKNSERVGIELQAADVKQIDIELQLGSASQTVEVDRKSVV